jgi:uncharacterized protein YraI
LRHCDLNKIKVQTNRLPIARFSACLIIWNKAEEVIMKKTRFIAALAAAAAISFTSFTPATPVLAAPVSAPAELRGTPVTRIRTLVNLNVRTGPGTGYRRIGTLHAGHVVHVTGASDNYQWWRVRTPWGTGWVSASALYSRPVAWR